jgi:hypothetical protein
MMNGGCKIALATLTLAALLTGCATMQSGTPDDNAVLAAGDVGALGCAAFAIEGKPAEVAQARQAVAAAKAVLASATPTLTTFELAVGLAGDPRWQPIARAIVERVRVRTGGADPIPRDSTAFRVAEAFVAACGPVLGA